MFFFLIATVHCVTLIQGYQFHQYINNADIQQIFKSEQHGTVPEYDIVTINLNHIQKRSSHNEASLLLSFNAFNKTHNFHFKKNENLLMGKYTHLYTSLRNNKFFLAPYNSDIFAYHDIKKRAAIITARNENDEVEVHGTIGDDMSIQPINSLLKNLESETINRLRKFSKRSTDNFNKFFSGNHHIVIKQKIPLNRDYGVSEIVNYASNVGASETKTKRDVVDTVYPGILVSVDYDLYKSKNLNNDDLMRYIFAFYNSVDLRFRSLQSPKVRLSIRAVLAAAQPEGITYYTNDTIDSNNLNIAKTLQAMEKFFWKNPTFQLLNPDLIIGMIGRESVGVRDENHNWAQGIVGQAHVRGACDHDSNGRTRAVLVAAVQEHFLGINTVIHELGHSLGAQHDGLVKLTETCIDEPHIMYPIASESLRDWSVCSQNMMRAFLTSFKASCLRDKPTVRKPYPMLLPGQILKSLNEQCEEKYPYSEAVIERDLDDFPCSILRCATKQGSDVVIDTIRGTYDGTPCNDEDAICVLGRCITPSMYEF